MCSSYENSMLKIDIRRIDVVKGFLLGTLIVVISFFRFSINAGIILGLITVISCSIRISSYLANVLYPLFMAISCCTASQIILEAGGIWNLPMLNIFAELVFTLIIISLIYVFLPNIKLASWLGSGLLIVLSIADYYVYLFRGNALTPMDIFSFGTAITVADSYNFIVPSTMFYGLILWIDSLILGRGIKKCIANRWVGVIATLLFMGVFSLIGSTITVDTIANRGAITNGYFVNFGIEVKYLVESIKLRNYSSEEKIHFIEEEYESKKEVQIYNTEKPNIIVIMDESFADLRILGEIEGIESITPFIDSMTDNTIKGYALASVFGGGTANSEYEFLTGNTMAFLPIGTTAYQLYVNDESYSMASYLKSLGYKCIATHPYSASNWSRTKVYPLLGFDEFFAIDKYPKQNLVRDYISDQEFFDLIIKTYEEKGDEQLFVFGVSMQNHGGYDYSGNGFTPKVELDVFSQNYPDAEQYLGLVSETDKAVETLINYFSKVEEDVVICFFGDHLPHLNKQFYSELQGGSDNSLRSQQLMYTIPFFVWTNYDSENENIDITSINYLSNYVYKAAGIEIPPYNRFLLEMENVFPAINTVGVLLKEKGEYYTFDQLPDDTLLIETYKMLEYNSIFGGKQKSTFFIND